MSGFHFEPTGSGDCLGAPVTAPSSLSRFLLNKGTFTRFDPPGSIFTEAIGINAAGHIVGDYIDASGKLHGFLVTP
jgi:hypothetical protein